MPYNSLLSRITGANNNHPVVAYCNTRIFFATKYYISVNIKYYSKTTITMLHKATTAFPEQNP